MAAPNKVQNVDTPASFALAVSTNATIDPPCRGIYVGGTGDVTVNMAGDGATVVFSGVPAGVILPVRVTMVLTAGTTATNMTSLW